MNIRTYFLATILIIAATSDFSYGQRSRTSMALSNYSSAEQLRDIHRMGAQLEVAGASGLAGIGVNFNVTGRDLGYFDVGRGDSFQTFGFGWRRYLGGESLSPFFSMGFTRWANFSNKSAIEQTTPAFVAERLMSTSDKLAGKMDENLLNFAVGIEFLQLSGGWSGFGVHGSVHLLFDPSEFVTATTFGVATKYFF